MWKREAPGVYCFEKPRVRSLNDSIRLAIRKRSILRVDCISQRFVSSQPLVEHPGEHRNRGIDVVVDLDRFLAVMLAVQPADILLQGSPLRDRHREKERVQTRVVEAFSDVAARGNHYSRAGFRRGKFPTHLCTLFRSHSALQHEYSIDVLAQPGAQRFYMFSPSGQHQRRPGA
jgi:hypothetical protein